MRSNPGLHSLYHLCFEMGRFPYELPADLPDAQILLMFSYLSIKADTARSTDQGLGERALTGEQIRQQAEQVAWENHMSGR